MNEPLSAYVRRTGCDETPREIIADHIAEMEKALRALTFYLREPHQRIGNACGIDVCIICLAEATVRKALGAR